MLQSRFSPINENSCVDELRRNHSQYQLTCCDLIILSMNKIFEGDIMKEVSVLARIAMLSALLGSSVCSQTGRVRFDFPNKSFWYRLSLSGHNRLWYVVIDAHREVQISHIPRHQFGLFYPGSGFSHWLI
jgi:hypothetical protein